jgi:EAL domain-containing protein (putative c-di-GMP-specific phosphodiesterase class I)
MNHCSRCSAPPLPISEAGILYISPPLAHTLGGLRKLMDRIGVRFSEPSANLMAIPLSAGVLAPLAEGLSEVLSQAELRDSRSLILAEGASPTLADLGSMLPLATLVARTRGSWFADMLREDRFVSHFQPIVAAADPSKLFAHESLLRGVDEDGSLIPPSHLYQAARDSDMLFPLDRSARLKAIRSAAEHGLDRAGGQLFINFNPTSVYDPVYCLRSTVAAIKETKFRPEQIVFEIVESDHVADLDHLVRIADFYRKAGFKIALDDLGAGYGSLNLLVELKPDFVKLDMQLVRGINRDSYKSGIVRKLLEMSRDLGISTVAEGIETPEEWECLRNFGADYVQGFFFGRPASPPPQPRRVSVSMQLESANAGRDLHSQIAIRKNLRRAN